MLDQRDARTASEVRVDLSTLSGDPVGTDTRYAIALDGPVDERWAEAYRMSQEEAAIYRRFELDRSNGSIRFSCRTVDGTGLVFEMLERLEMLVGRVNQLVEIWRAQSPRISLAVSSLRAR